jgi:hypothetical protein
VSLLFEALLIAILISEAVEGSTVRSVISLRDVCASSVSTRGTAKAAAAEILSVADIALKTLQNVLGRVNPTDTPLLITLKSSHRNMLDKLAG